VEDLDEDVDLWDGSRDTLKEQNKWMFIFNIENTEMGQKRAVFRKVQKIGAY
jgi:hypothetical protein